MVFLSSKDTGLCTGNDVCFFIGNDKIVDGKELLSATILKDI